MLITPHALTGATIAVIIPNPVIALPLAIGSHFVLDSILHWQEILYPYKITFKTWIRIPIDLIVAMVLVGIITNHHTGIANVIWLSAFMAILPDFDFLGVILKSPMRINLLKRYCDWHCAIQKETASFKGILTQLILSATCLLISLK